jgi:F5/8 type C domain
VLAVYTGTAVNALTVVGSNDDACGLGSRVSFTAAAGTEYRIAVDGYGNDSGSFTLAWRRTPAPPVPVRWPSVSGIRRVGETLTVTPGEWSGLQPIAFAFQWQRCWNGCTEISGATGSTYALGAADVGFVVAVVVTATNAGGSTTAFSAAGLIEALAPRLELDPNVDDIPRAGDTVFAQRGSWAGPQPLAYAYQWQRCSSDPLGSNLANVALHSPVRVSNVFPANPAAAAVDGSLESFWSAGAFGRQWIEIDLGVPTPVAALRLYASQSPSGLTAHRVTGRSDGSVSEQLLHEFSGRTSDRQMLDSSLLGDRVVRFVRVETTSSPSWVAWREIEVLSRCRDIPGATREGYQPRPDDIGFSLRFIVRATNAGGTTAAVSSETEPVVGCVVPRLAGKVLRAVRVALNAAGCRLGGVGRTYARVRAGRIARQSAAPGTRRVYRAPIHVLVSRGPRP